MKSGLRNEKYNWRVKEEKKPGDGPFPLLTLTIGRIIVEVAAERKTSFY